MARSWLVVAIFLIAACARPVWAWTGKVTHITDGDTVWVASSQGGQVLKLRILGIDAPEICQAGGPAARAALASRVERRMVSVNLQGQDSHGRALGTLYLGQEDIAGWMVAQGQAWSYGREGEPYRPLQAQARRAGRGLFADPPALPPRLFRKRHGSCHP